MIEFKNFTLRFPHKILFQELNQSFEQGKIYGVFGLNAVGKSSFFKALYGMLSYKGTIHWKEKKITKNEISFLETENYFYPGLTGQEYLEIFINTYPDIFDIFALAEMLCIPLEKLVDEYSTGMKKKIAFLGILKTNRDVFLLDEPFNGIDTEATEIIKSILKQLKKQNKTVFITSHIVEHIQSIADFIFVIENYETTFLMNPVEFHHYISGLNTIIDNKIEKITLL